MFDSPRADQVRRQRHGWRQHGTLDAAASVQASAGLLSGTDTTGRMQGLSNGQADRPGKLDTAAGGDAAYTTANVAYQLALWKTLHDSTPGCVAAGDVGLPRSGSAAQRNRADAWLATLLDPSATSFRSAQRLCSSMAQDVPVCSPLPPQRRAPGAARWAWACGT